MENLYLRISLFYGLFILVIVDLLILIKPIRYVSDKYEIWIAWLIIILSSSIKLKTNSFNSFLHGTNRVSIQKSLKFLLI